MAAAFGSCGAILPRTCVETPPRQRLGLLASISYFQSEAGIPQVREPESGRASDAGLAAIRRALKTVETPNFKSVAKSLGLTISKIGKGPFESSDVGMEVVGDLDGDGVPELALKGKATLQARGESVPFAEALYFLSWDGQAWRVSDLGSFDGAFTLEALPGMDPADRLIAVIVFQDATLMPYPIIYRYRAHTASLAWDSRLESSSYTGYDYGSVRFKGVGEGSAPEMMVSGRADPGLLVFPRVPDANGRGFRVASLYFWRHNAYVPLRTEYEPCEDYTEYRFIRALHLRDFHSAYSLVEPRKFLKTSKPSLEFFRKRVQEQWPEFLDDRIFRVPLHPKGKPGGHLFALTVKEGDTYLYHPTFTPGPKYLLTGLEREKVRP